MRYLRRSPQETGIDVSPLIDMVFILLIFFMVSTTFVKDLKVDLERPGAASGERASTKAVRISLDREGAIALEGVPVKPWMLQSRLRDLLRTVPDAPILVVADRRAPVERLVEVVDQARLAGAQNVGVATDRETH